MARGAAVERRAAVETGAGMEPDAEEIRRMLHRVEVEGWDSPTGRRLLQLVRQCVARPAIRRSGLSGPAADQAESSAWVAAWDALRRPSARAAQSPFALAQVAARRAVWAEVRAANPGAAHGMSVSSLDSALEAGLQLPAVASPGDDESTTVGRALPAIVDALVAAGWTREVIGEAIALLADSARPRAARPAPATPAPAAGCVAWRSVALRLGLPEWQVRRLAVLLLGRPGLPGLLEQVRREGVPVLEAPASRDAVRATVRRWMSAPEQSLAELAGWQPAIEQAS